MRILHAIGWYFPESLGGTEVYVASLAARLRDAGHSCAVVAPLAGLAEPQSYVHNEIPVYRYSIPSKMTRAEAQGRTRARGAEGFDDVVRKFNPDVVHFHTFLAGLGVHEVAAARASAPAVIATNHLASLGFICQRGTLMRWGSQPCDGILAPLKCSSCELQHRGMNSAAAVALGALGFAFLGREKSLPEGRVATSLLMTDLICDNRRKQNELLSLLDKFVVLNKAARKMLILNGAPPEKLAVNYLGTSHESAQRKSSPDVKPTSGPITIGYVGRLTEIKGIIDLARAAASLPRSLDFRIRMHGPLSDIDSTRTVAKVRQIIGDDSRVTIEDPIPSDEISRAMASFDVLWVPSIWFENGPTVVSEAFGAGTPVIGTTIGAMPELITHGVNGLLLEPGNSQLIASTIRQMVEDPANTIDKWRRSVPFPRTMTTITTDYLDLYQQVLAGKPRVFSESGGVTAAR